MIAIIILIVQYEGSQVLRVPKSGNGQKPNKHKCDRVGCNKSFLTPFALRAHIRTHTGEKPFKCGFCGQGFAQKNNLTRHERIHTDVKAFNCPTCGKEFARKDHLERHAGKCSY